jgi:hypothetical protein
VDQQFSVDRSHSLQDAGTAREFLAHAQKRADSYVFIKKVATGPSSTRDVRILGGRHLLPEAEKKRKKQRVDIQSLLEGVAYNPDLLWSREARKWVKERVRLFFILTLLLGTSALTGSSFATQLLLTKQAAASVIRTSDAPALK